MTAQPVQELLVSPEDYLETELLSEVKREYLCGHMYPRPDTNNLHNQIAGNVFGTLGASLRGSPCRPFNSDTKVRIRQSRQLRFYYPDFQVTCHPNPDDDTFQDRPILIVEVLSESTRRTDEVEKLDGYLSIPTLENYLLVETGKPLVICYRRTAFSFTREVHSGLDAVIALPSIGTELPLVEVYERVCFDQPEG